MYAGESLSFDPTSQQNEVLDEKGLLQNHIPTTCVTNFSMGEELQQKFHSSENNNMNMQEFGHHDEHTNTVLPCVHPNWEEIGFNPNNNQLLSYPISSSLGHLGGFHQRTEIPSTSTNLFYELPQLNMPINLCTQQPSLFKDLFHLSPHGSSYGFDSSGTGSLFSHGHHEEEVTGALYHDGSFHHEFSTGDMINSAAIKKREGNDMKHHASEKLRRIHFSDKFQALRTLIPNPSKNDRATIIVDAIGYINELKMRVNDLRNEIDLKKEMMRMKRQRIVEEDGAMIMEADEDQVVMNKSIMSNWHHQRKCTKNSSTEVDVRVMEDEVSIKLVQQKEMMIKKRMNCLVFVSKALDELRLDLQHVAGGLIGDHYSYLFNSKICEGCTVYASAIANKVIEVLDKEHATIN
ncbi:putative 3-hydroxyisobutyryl-CoA hydrolase 1-like [Capsicum annuum]|nr:putative 3-hydroxyisobutyryl-CoA hydrolase 1-like [Capsicum annuum]